MKKSVRYIIIIIDFILILILISPFGSNRLVTLINLQYSYYYFAQSLIYRTRLFTLWNIYITWIVSIFGPPARPVYTQLHTQQDRLTWQCS